MDLRKIKKLIEMLQESDLNEIEVKEGEESVRINRKKESSVQPNLPSFNVPVQQTTSQEIQVEGYKTLKEGAAVTFEPGDGEKGPVAKNIVNV